MSEPDQTISVEGKVTIKVGDTVITLTMSEARALHAQIGTLIGSPTVITYPVIYPQYPVVYGPYSFRDNWRDPFRLGGNPTITCEDRSTWSIVLSGGSQDWNYTVQEGGIQ